MSLINEMLHDLDTGRRQNFEPASDDDSLLASSVKLSSKSSSTWLPTLIVFVVVALLLIWQQLMPDSAAELTVDKAATSAFKSEPALLTSYYYPELTKSVQTDKAKIVAEVDSVSDSSDVAQLIAENTVQQQKIMQLLGSASKAFALDRLLTPADDNAANRYREILLLAPNNKQAISGLESVAQRYIDLALDYASQGNDERANLLFRRASGVIPESATIRAAVVKARKDALKQHKQIQARQPLQAKPRSLEGNSVTTSTTPSKVATSLPVAQTIFRVRSDYWRDADAARTAKILLSRGRDLEALQNLRDYIVSNPHSTHALSVLLHGLIEREKLSEAQQWLSRAKHLSVSDSTEYSAHILLASNSITSAITLLESKLPEAVNDPSYHVLLTGLYHQNGDYTDAVATYANLLREHGNKSEYWLGLAVGLDSLERDDEALKAFISASDSTQNEQVQRYIASRIQALSS